MCKKLAVSALKECETNSNLFTRHIAQKYFSQQEKVSRRGLNSQLCSIKFLQSSATHKQDLLGFALISPRKNM